MPDTEHAAQAQAQGRPEPMWPVMWSPARVTASHGRQLMQKTHQFNRLSETLQHFTRVDVRAPDGGTVI